MILGIVGSTELTDDERQVVTDYATEFLDKNKDITEILHLNSTGVEEAVINLARERGLLNESIPIFNYTWNGGKTQGVVEGTFKDANIKLIDRCDRLLVMTTARDKSGGPLWAAKRARKLQVPTIQKTFVARTPATSVEVVDDKPRPRGISKPRIEVNEISPSGQGSAK